MKRLVIVLNFAAVSVISAQAFAVPSKSVRARAVQASPSYYCGILKAYGQTDLKECGPFQLRK